MEVRLIAKKDGTERNNYISIETHNNIRTVYSESSCVKLTRFEIEEWLELIATPSVDGHVVYYINSQVFSFKKTSI